MCISQFEEIQGIVDRISELQKDLQATLAKIRVVTFLGWIGPIVEHFVAGLATNVKKD